MPKVTFIDLPEEALTQSLTSEGRLSPPYAVPPARKEVFLPKWLPLTLAALVARQNLAANILALLLGRASIMGEIAPFGLAFFGAAVALSPPKDRSAAIGLWALAGVLSAGKYWEGAIYLLSMVLYWRFSDKLRRSLKSPHAVPVFFLSSVFLRGLAVFPWRDTSLYGLLMIVADAFFCLALIYIFQYGMPLFLGRSKPAGNVSEQLTCLTLMLAIGVAGLTGLTVFEHNLNSIAGSLFVMALAMTGGAGLGAAVGVAIGFSNGLNGADAAASVAMYSLAGLLGGVFREFGKPAVIIGFLLGNAVFLMYLAQNAILPGQIARALAEPAIAAVLFFMLPARGLTAFGKEHLQPQPQAIAAETGQQLAAVAEKLGCIAKTLGGFGEAARAAGNREQAEYKAKIKDSQLNEMLARVGTKVCDSCRHRSDCWDKEFYPIYQAMLEMLALAESGELSEKKVPLPIKSYCANKGALADLINQVVQSNQIHWYWQKKLTDCRMASAEQLKAAGDIIANLVSEVKREPRNDTEVAERLKRQAEELGCPLIGVKVTGNGDMVAVTAQKQPCDNTRECLNTVLPLTANILKEKMTLKHECGLKSKNKPCRLVMSLAEKYSVEIGAASAAKGDNTRIKNDVSGDRFACFKLGQGKDALVLSDGMGSGSLAAAESGAAVEFLKKLLTAGFDVDVAVKTVNSMMLLRTSPDSFATLDMTIIDAYTCEAEFLKVGAAPSFIKRVREVFTVESTGLPAGIIEEIEIEPQKKTLMPGDMVIMVSDGILERVSANSKESWVVNYLRRLASEDPQEIAASILRQAKTLHGNSVEDDMTVIVAKIAERMPGQ